MNAGGTTYCACHKKTAIHNAACSQPCGTPASCDCFRSGSPKLRTSCMYVRMFALLLACMHACMCVNASNTVHTEPRQSRVSAVARKNKRNSELSKPKKGASQTKNRRGLRRDVSKSGLETYTAPPAADFQDLFRLTRARGFMVWGSRV